MKRFLWAVAAAAFAAGCGDTPENGGNGGDGGGARRDWPTSGEWRRVEPPPSGYPPEDAAVDTYAGERRAEALRRNFFQSLVVTQYLHRDWDRDPKKPDIRRLRVELWRHQHALGAAKTFQQWHGGHSITDVGEKAFADADAIVFLRANYVVRIVPTGPRGVWKAGEAGKPAIALGQALDGWLQGK